MVSRDLIVIARNSVDGFYYPGYKTGPITDVDVKEDSEILVNFWAIRPQQVPQPEVIPIRGAIPWPEPTKGSFVLAAIKCRSSKIECYLPGIVIGLPINLGIEHRFYSIRLFNGNRVTKIRRNFIVIGKEKHDRIVSYIDNQRRIRHCHILREVVQPPLACERGKKARSSRFQPRVSRSLSSITSSQRTASSATSSRSSMSSIGPKKPVLDRRKSQSLSSTASSSTSFKSTSSSRPSSSRRILSPGTDVLARWSDDGWYYWGRVDGRAPEAEDSYMVRDSTGFVAPIADDDLLTEEQQTFQAIQPKNHVIALHPAYVYSYAPATVGSTYTHGAIVQFYDGKSCKRPWSELYQITGEKFKQCVEYIIRRENQMTSLNAIALDGSSEYYKLVQIEGEADRQQYFVPSYQNYYIKQKAIHIFPLQHMGVSSHHMQTCRYILGPKDDQCTRYLAAEVHIAQRPGDNVDNRENNSAVYTLNFCDGTTRTLDSLEKCFYLSEDYFQYATSFYQHQTSQNWSSPQSLI